MENEILQQIFTELKDIKQGQTEMQADIGFLKGGQAKLEAGQAKLEAGQANLEDDIKALKADMSTVKADVKTIKRDVKELYQLSDAAFADILRLDNRIEALK